jgi:hypothetical protein
MCLAEAIHFCYPEEDLRKEVFKKINEHIKNNISDNLIRVSSWNDTHNFEDLIKLIETLNI